MFYIDQHRTPSFPLALVKTESGFIVRSALLLDQISIDAYPFLAFSDLTCDFEDTGLGVFWLHCAAWQ